MPRGVDLSPSTAILQAFEQGYRERLANEQMQFNRQFKTAQLKQQSDEATARQKQAEAQLKATEEFRRANLQNQQATLDFHKAVQESQAKQQSAKLKLDYLQGVRKGEIKPLTQEVTPEEFAMRDPESFGPAERYRMVPEKFSPLPGVDINRGELPEIAPDPLQLIEARFAEQADLQTQRDKSLMDRLNQTEIASSVEKLADRESREKIAGMRIAARKAENASKQKSIDDSRLTIFLHGEAVPTAKERADLNDVAKNYEWADGSRGAILLSRESTQALRGAQLGRRAVEMSIELADALNNIGRPGKVGEEALSRAIQLSKNIRGIIPSLRDTMGARNLGVLSKPDIDMLEANIPNIGNEVWNRALRHIGGLSSLKASWNSERAKTIYQSYQRGLKNITNGMVSGQKDFLNEKYGLAPEILNNWHDYVGGKSNAPGLR